MNTFLKFIDFLEPHFKVNDNILTPNGSGLIIGIFTRGLKWWYETDKGTFNINIIHKLNDVK